MISRIYIHAGLHRTGTTSFQHSLLRNKKVLKRNGVEVYKPIKRKVNASEVGEAVIDPEKKGITREEQRELFFQVQSRISECLDLSLLDSLLISGEDISYIRTNEECQRLKKLFPRPGLEFVVLLVMRDTKEWLSSYSNKINELREEGSPKKNSRAYLEPDGWLTDFDSLVKSLRRNFDTVTIIDYDKEDTLSTLYEHIGVDPRGVHKGERVNSSNGRQSRLSRVIWRAAKKCYRMVLDRK